MKSSELKKFKNRLLAQQEEIQSIIQEQDATRRSTLVRETGDSVEDAATEVLTPLTESERGLLKKIDFALSRIAAGTYGICTQCKTWIPLSRLEAKPSASLCLECQREHEHAVS
jgi:DnaK suppressor protein